MATQAEKAKNFWALHERADAFIIPNPWDPGSACLLAGLGFEVRAVTAAVSNPVNVLAPPLKNVTVAQLSEAGVKHISVGGALARAVIAALRRAGREMRDQGSFAWTADATPGSEINKLMESGDSI